MQKSRYPILPMRRPHSRFPSTRALAPAPLALALSLSLSGCLSDDAQPAAPEVSAPTALSSEAGFRMLEGLGYNRDHIIEKPDGFLVEGDMYFDKAKLAARPASPLAKTSQKRTEAVVAPAPNLIKLTIHSSMADWAHIVNHAVNTWNSVGTRLHIEIVPSGGHITVHSDKSASCPASMRNQNDKTGAIGEVNWFGEPGANICVNKDNPNVTSNGERAMILTHEMGHTIGFHHTNDATGQGIQIPGTPASDPASIMGTLGNTSYVLSYYDMVALEMLYPCDKPLGGTDFDGDKKDDLVVYRPSDPGYHVLRSGTGFTSGFFRVAGQRGDTPMADMDLDGDGIDDRVQWRALDGVWRARLSMDGAVKSWQWGQAGDIPIAGHDYDGDGRDDLVVWRWKDKAFYVLASASNYTAGHVYYWGDLGDIPVGGIDADRDGKDEWIVWRATDAKLWISYSRNGFTTWSAFSWGPGTYRPVGGMDLDRNGWDDFALFRPASGTWSNGHLGSNVSIPWGQSGDVPVRGTDVDQDGKKDVVVWRPSDGVWYVLKSNAAWTTWVPYQWGM